MNLLYVYHGDWPRNATRPTKHTRSLAGIGHRIHLLSGNPNGKPRLDSEGWLTVERLPSFGSPKAHRVLGFPVFLNPVWLWATFRAARRCKADSIIVRDLPLAPAALMVGRLVGAPVHFDMADVYTVLMRTRPIKRERLMARIFRRLTRNPVMWEYIERVVLKRVASVFVVSEESGARCVELGVPAERVVMVGNTPESLIDLSVEHSAPEDIADWAGRPMMVFIGNLLQSRGLPEAVEATALVARDFPEFAFVIVGDGPELPRLKADVERRGLHEHVRLLGWKSHDEHAPYYTCASIGVLPFLPTKHICITLANKLFDYMAAELAVLATDVPPMRRVLDETGAGLLVSPGDAEALAEGIAILLRDPELRQRLGKAGRRAVETTYSWAHDRQRLIDAVERPYRTAG